MNIMTGKTGTPHVTSQQFRQLVEGTVGQGSYILSSGEKLEPELQTNNLLKIRSGMMSHHGNLSVVDLGTYDEVTIQNGTQGMQRIDLVVNRYTRDEETGIEKNEWIVIQGTPAASDPQVPAHTEGNLQEGDLVDDCPVFEVHLDGINVTEVVKLLEVSPDIPTLNASLSKLIGNMFYKPGDDVEVSSLVAFGVLTTSKTQMMLTIPVAKSLENIQTAQLVNASGLIRQGGKYLINSDGTAFNFTQSRATLMILKNSNTIRLTYTFSSALDAMNNDLLSVQFYSGKLELS